ESEMKLEVMTDWKMGSPIIIKGFHHVAFENKGIVLKYEPSHALAYSSLSSLSRLADQPENYSIIEFRLASIEEGTQLTLLLNNFPTESIFKHLDFYWTTTLQILKKEAEQQTAGIQIH
ncbi:MAG TPA: SRPBCC domain-containing protein, partial [Cyclobacteriaceae bacterium]